MRNVDYPPDEGFITPTSRVAFRGATTEAHSWRVDREIPSHLPEQVTGAGGQMSADGEVTWAPAEDITRLSPVPWGGSATPRPAESVIIHAGRGDVQSRVFTGQVATTTGALSPGSQMSSSLIDRTPRLRRPVSQHPLARVMPPPTTDGSTNPLNIGLHSTYFTDKWLRTAGFYATPSMESGCFMSAPLAGSSWPERGTLVESSRDGDWHNQPYYATAPWGVCASYLQAAWTPDFPTGVDGRLTRPMQVTMCIGRTPDTSGAVQVSWPGGAAIRLTVTSSRSVLIQLRFSSGGDWSTILTATTGTLGQWRTVTVRLQPRESTDSIRASIRTNNLGAATGAWVSRPGEMATQPVSEVRVLSNGVLIGGVQASFPSDVQFGAVNETPTAVLSTPQPFETLLGSPAIVSTPALDLLKEQAEAVCAALWIDEDGVAQWRSRQRFVEGQSVWEGNSTDNLLDLEWAHEATGVRNSATVKYRSPATTRRTSPSILVWQGSGETLRAGDSTEAFATSGGDESWFGVSLNARLYTGDTGGNAVRDGTRTLFGYTAYDSDNNYVASTGVDFTYDVRRITHETWLVEHSCESLPSGVDHLRTQVRESTGVPAYWHNESLPMLRARMRHQWSDEAYTASEPGAPADAAALEHDAGWHIQTESQAASLAHWLAQQTAAPAPVVQGLRIVPDARIQLGDKITVHDTHRSGLTIVGVVTGLSQSMTPERHDMSLRVRLTHTSAAPPSLADYDTWMGNRTLIDRDAAWGTDTLSQFDTAPLSRR